MISDDYFIDIIAEQYPELQLKYSSSDSLYAMEAIAEFAQQLLEREAYNEFKFLCAFLNQLYYLTTENARARVDGLFLEKVSDTMFHMDDSSRILPLLPTRMRMTVEERYRDTGPGKSYAA